MHGTIQEGNELLLGLEFMGLEEGRRIWPAISRAPGHKHKCILVAIICLFNMFIHEAIS